MRKINDGRQIVMALAAGAALALGACGGSSNSSTGSSSNTSSTSQSFTCCLNGENFSCPNQAAETSCGNGDSSGCTSTGMTASGQCS